MMQESVYSKIALNQNVATGICDSVKSRNRRRVLCKCLPLPKTVRQNGNDCRQKPQQCCGFGRKAVDIMRAKFSYIDDCIK